MFGKVIADRRAEKKISIDDFCKECQCTRQSLWNWEHNEAVPVDAAKIKICKILDLPIDIFFEDRSK